MSSFNTGMSLQALMTLLGHVSAEMRLRYGRVFDTTIRDEYERALTLAHHFPGSNTFIRGGKSHGLAERFRDLPRMVGFQNHAALAWRHQFNRIVV